MFQFWNNVLEEGEVGESRVFFSPSPDLVGHSADIQGVGQMGVGWMGRRFAFRFFHRG